MARVDYTIAAKLLATLFVKAEQTFVEMRICLLRRRLEEGCSLRSNAESR